MVVAAAWGAEFILKYRAANNWINLVSQTADLCFSSEIILLQCFLHSSLVSCEMVASAFGRSAVTIGLGVLFLPCAMCNATVPCAQDQWDLADLTSLLELAKLSPIKLMRLGLPASSQYPWIQILIADLPDSAIVPIREAKSVRLETSNYMLEYLHRGFVQY